jgi:hypothetical protein
MKRGVCPKCGSATVYSQPGGLGFANQANIYINVGNRAKASTTRAYLCAACGYYEVYLTDKDFLGEAAKAWSRVPAR